MTSPYSHLASDALKRIQGNIPTEIHDELMRMLPRKQDALVANLVHIFFSHLASTTTYDTASVQADKILTAFSNVKIDP